MAWSVFLFRGCNVVPTRFNWSSLMTHRTPISLTSVYRFNQMTSEALAAYHDPSMVADSLASASRRRRETYIIQNDLLPGIPGATEAFST